MYNQQQMKQEVKQMLGYLKDIKFKVQQQTDYLIF